MELDQLLKKQNNKNKNKTKIMGYTHNNPLPRMKSALNRMKAEKKMGLHRDSALHNAEQYGIKGNDELDYMPIMDHGAATPMHRQGYNDRLDDALGGKHGHKSQALVDRRHESEGMERHFGHHKFAGDKNMK